MIFAHPAGHDRAIGYDVHGEGPAVLLLHPFPFDRRYWAGLELDGYRVIAIDARGYGDSSPSDFGIDDLAEDAVALLDHLGIAMAVVVGASMGGYVALAIAARHPARLSALVLCGTRAGADGESARSLREAASRDIAAHGPAGFLEGVGVRLCARSASAAVRAKAQALAASSSPALGPALCAMLRALGGRPDRSALLPTLRVPVLVLVGAEDSISPPDEARDMKRAIPGAALVELPATGHLASLEQPIAFAAALTQFLDVTIKH